MHRGDDIHGIDLGGAVAGSDVHAPDGRRGRVTTVGAHHLEWTWLLSWEGSTGTVQLRLEESDDTTSIEVTERADWKDVHDADVFWEQWFGALDDWTRFPTESDERRGLIRYRTDEIWSPRDPRLSELEALTALRRGEHSSSLGALDKVALQALLVRALAAQGKLDEAEKELHAAFSGFKEAPAWVPMLEALERGRIYKERAARVAEADAYADVDELWTEAAEHLARCIWIAPERDLDLVLEAAWELATMTTTADGPGYTSLWAEFGSAVAARAPADVHTAWSPRFAALSG